MHYEIALQDISCQVRIVTRNVLTGELVDGSHTYGGKDLFLFSIGGTDEIGLFVPPLSPL